MKKTLIALFALFAFPVIAWAIQITVPSAPSSGYYLVSTSTGAYVASSTPNFGTGFNNAATSTGSFGINLSGGCFAVNGTCVTTGSSASSTLLSDNNTFSGVNKFTNSSSDFSGTWQTFSPSHFQTALTLPLSILNGGTATSTQVTNGVNYFDGTHISSSNSITWDGTNFIYPNLTSSGTGATGFSTSDGTFEFNNVLFGKGGYIATISTAATTSYSLTASQFCNFENMLIPVGNTTTVSVIFPNNAAVSAACGTINNGEFGMSMIHNDSSFPLTLATTSSSNLTFFVANGTSLSSTNYPPQVPASSTAMVFPSQNSQGLFYMQVIVAKQAGLNPLQGILPILNGGTATSTQITNGINYYDGSRITSNILYTIDSTNHGLVLGNGATFAGTINLKPADSSNFMWMQNRLDSQSANQIMFSFGSTPNVNLIGSIDQNGGFSLGANYASTQPPTNGMIIQGITAVGSTTPVANFQATNASANSTTTVELGKSAQTKGTCIKLYRTDGSAVYAYVAAGATAFTLSTTANACSSVTGF